MNYDQIQPTGLVCTSQISCAFNEVRDSFNRQYTYVGNWSYGTPMVQRWETNQELEDRLWKTLCEILVASETRPVLIPTTDREGEMKDLLAACPYIELVSEHKSRHGRYKAQLWIAQVHPKGEVHT